MPRRQAEVVKQGLRNTISNGKVVKHISKGHTMQALNTGTPFPQTKLHALGGDMVTLGQPRDGHTWQLVVIYRGLHCPICKTYLKKLDQLVPDFNAIGVDVVAASGDTQAKAQAMIDEMELGLSMGYAMTTDQMGALGLWISSPRSPQELDRPFSEPGVFVINEEGRLKMVDISNAPFLRPDLDMVLRGVTANQVEGYPFRGTFGTP
ncbi:MAG: peroxiredoxin [Ascidiaceihabitans sp.]|jgi:peroxiredoxin